LGFLKKWKLLSDKFKVMVLSAKAIIFFIFDSLNRL